MFTVILILFVAFSFLFTWAGLGSILEREKQIISLINRMDVVVKSQLSYSKRTIDISKDVLTEVKKLPESITDDTVNGIVTHLDAILLVSAKTGIEDTSALDITDIPLLNEITDESTFEEPVKDITEEPKKKRSRSKKSKTSSRGDLEIL